MTLRLTLLTVLLAACSLSSSGLLPSPTDGGADATLDSGYEAATDGGLPDTSPDVGPDAPLPPQPTPPDTIGGMVLWLRGDKGISLVDMDGGGSGDGGTALQAWNDSSDAGDPNHNAAAVSPQSAPTFVATNPQYGNRPTVHFEDPQLLKTGFFASTVAQPATVLVVGHTSSGGATDRYLLDSLHVSTPLSLYTAGTGEVGALLDSVQANGGFATKNALRTAIKPSVVVLTLTGSTSRLYVSTSLPTQVNVGPNGAAGFTIGNWAGGGAFSAKADVAEVAVWKRALSQVEIDGLNLYANARYGIVIN